MGLRLCKSSFILTIIFVTLISKSEQHHDHKYQSEPARPDPIPPPPPVNVIIVRNASVSAVSSSSEEGPVNLDGSSSSSESKEDQVEVTRGKSHKQKNQNRPILPKGMLPQTESPIIYPPRKLYFMLSAKNLDKVLTSKQDKTHQAIIAPNELNPFLQIFYSSEISDLHQLESEIIRHTASPTWNTVFTFIWQNNTGQKWNIKVKSRNPPNPDFILSEISVDVDKYVASQETIALALADTNGDNAVELSNTAVLQITRSTTLRVKVYARNLARRDPFNGKSDPYVRSYWRRGPDGIDNEFGRTSGIDNVEDADWNDILDFQSYQENANQYWVFKVFDKDGFSNDEFLGQAFVKVDSLVKLVSDERKRTIDLTNESGGRTKRDRIRGTLTVFLVDDEE